MIGKFIILMVVVLMVVLMLFLLHGSDFFTHIRNCKDRLIETVQKKKEESEVKISNGPILRVRFEGQKRYCEMKVESKRFQIGRGRKNSLPISSKTVEKKHAVIYRRQKGRNVYYELVNYAKSNPVEYFNKQKQVYEYLGYRDGVKLDVRDAFYVGENKIIVSLPEISHSPTSTEYFNFNYDEETSDHRGKEEKNSGETKIFNIDKMRMCV